MFIKLEEDILTASFCYHEKDILKSIGFKWDVKRKMWKKKFTWNTMCEFVEKFQNHSEISTDEKTGKVFREACELEKQRLQLTTNLKIYKDKLLLDPKTYLNISDFDFNNKLGVLPFTHQKIALSYFKEGISKNIPIGALYADCGTGKTLTFLWLMRYLKQNNIAAKFLIICPCSVMYGAWKKDCEKYTPDLSLCVLDKSGEQNCSILNQNFERIENSDGSLRKNSLADKYNKSFDVYVINYEAIPNCLNSLSLAGFDLVILDESARLKNHKSITTKCCLKLAEQIPYRYISSGLPAPNGEYEYFSQINFLSPRVFGSDYYKFRENWFNSTGFQGFDFKLNENLRNVFMDKVYTHGLRFRLEDCEALPPQSFISVDAHLSSIASKKYIDIEQSKILTLLNKVLGITNPLQEMSILRQLANGFYYDHVINSEGKDIITPIHIHDAKLITLRELISSVNKDEQIIIWAHFKEDHERLKNEFEPNQYSSLVETSGPSREKAIEDFTSKKTRFLLANERSAAHGLTFVNAAYNILYSMDWSPETYYQLLKRTHRIGQTKKTIYHHILSVLDDGSPTIDSTLYYTVRNNIKNSVDVLNHYISIVENR